MVVVFARVVAVSERLVEVDVDQRSRGSTRVDFPWRERVTLRGVREVGTVQQRVTAIVVESYRLRLLIEVEKLDRTL